MRERLHTAVYETLRVLETEEIEGSDVEIAEAVELAQRLLARVSRLTERRQAGEARMARSAGPSPTG